MSKSLYDTLGINSNASAEEIKKAYRKLAKQYHPDKNAGDKSAEEKFKEINAAYEVLSNPEKKAQYDQYGDSMFGGQNFHDFARSQGRSGVDINDILRNIFGARSGFNDGFSGAFSSGFGGFSQQMDLDITAKLGVDFHTSVLGGKKSITLNGETFDVKIPAGIRTNDKLRVREKGKSFQGSRGDLFLVVEVEKSLEYEVDGDDLIKTISIPLKTAMFGGKVSVVTLEKEVTLKIPQNTKQNQKFRLKDLGILNRKTNVKGNLYLKSNIIIPDVETLDNTLVEEMKNKLPEV